MRMNLKRSSLLFLDSVNHFSAPLSKLPDMFGVVGLRKGFYPYKQPWSEYVGPLPPPSFFCMENRPSKERNEFLEWYDSFFKAKAPWDHFKETEAYCRNDVLVLSAALDVYIKDGRALTSLNPMNLTTIAGFALRTYLFMDMPENTLAILTKDEADLARKAYYGGRTDISNTLVELTDEQLTLGWRIKYLDFVSL
jgi:hypothetical protein